MDWNRISMIKIAICDDDQKQLEQARECLGQYQQAHPHIDLQPAFFTSSLELLNHVGSQGSFDIYLLDVYMSGYLGTDTARQLREHGDRGEIVFITSSRDHALEAYEVDARQYLVKPYTEADFFQVLDKVLERFQVERRNQLTLKTSKGVIRLFTRDVVFTESGRNNYQVIHLINKEKLEVRMTSSDLFELLAPTGCFVRCGASITINLKFVRQITREYVFFDTGEQVSYPYRAYPKLKEEFLSLHFSGGNGSCGCED